MLVPAVDRERRRRREEFSALVALVLEAVREHVAVEALLVFESFAAEAAQEGLAVVVGLDVLA